MDNTAMVKLIFAVFQACLDTCHQVKSPVIRENHLSSGSLLLLCVVHKPRKNSDFQWLVMSISEF